MVVRRALQCNNNLLFSPEFKKRWKDGDNNNKKLRRQIWPYESLFPRCNTNIISFVLKGFGSHFCGFTECGRQSLLFKEMVDDE